ncbi:ABC transporter substrate-binding protein [Mesorhizobium sp. CA13]|uniref:ABC transporter substrate-binding protein n=1 Tax=Mesorhizobium sp. CA13 TaxID=2876643 RepID=UPI001CC9116B|nr:ABC transporter substrate-binding protein [Mesorhizobium sp. CA13]MBZ9857100.1 ABC transporter substrate-binding protein [Mesorhizobium sp. CA13]
MKGPFDRSRTWLGLAVLAIFGLAGGAHAADRSLVMYCGVDEAWCRAMATTYQKETGVSVDMTRMSAGEIYARLRAEKDNPQADIWWGGTGDPHLQAAEEGLTQEYKSPQLANLRDWALRQAERAKNRTVGIYLGALGYGYNEEDLKQRGLAAPACWADLVKPDFQGEIEMADPNSSGTAWTMLATIVQLMGEDKAFDYLKQLNKNIAEYTKAGAAPALAVGKGETLVGISFQHDVINAAKQNPAVKVVSPCEGTGFEIGSMSIVAGAKHIDEAQKFYDWALTPDAQKLAAPNGSYQIPSNTGTPVPPEAPDLSKIKLIDYDFAKYGSSAERKRLLKKFTDEVRNGG